MRRLIVFICDLFVSRDDPLVGWKTSTRTERLCGLGRGGGWGRGWAPVGPVWDPQYFYTERSKAVLLLWFLTVLAVCVYTLVHLLC